MEVRCNIPLVLIILVSLTFGCEEKEASLATNKKHDTYQIKGSLQNGNGLTLFLAVEDDFTYTRPLPKLIDSTRVANDSFSFTGSIQYPVNARLYTKENPGWRPFILSNEPYHIEGDIKQIWKSTITESQSNELIKNFHKELNQIIYRMNAAADSAEIAQSNGDTLLANTFLAKNRACISEHDSLTFNFISANNESIAALLKFSSFINLGDDKKRELFKTFSGKIIEHPLAKKISYELFEEKKVTALGNEAIDFRLQDINGKEYSLNSFKGKYLLIDFWATWCGPCIAKFPELEKLSTNRKKDLTVLGVSIDRNKDKWIKYISSHELPWINVLAKKDENGWFLVDKYNIQQIPHSILIDSQGRIVGENLSFEKIENLIDRN